MKLDLLDGTILNVRGRANDHYSDLELKFSEICCTILGEDTIDITTDLMELGADSLSIMEICQEIEELYSIEIPLEDVTAANTVELLAALIKNKLK
ncbi:acyl carrier protein [Saccharicrinis aurantiacus]|uniref:acyl carrier protein n=1 Tax=Saccharicrinis aurantiacus TaxID=1849719 RepID=UPI00094FAFA1|nr:acyl carrier protein [Saccharicrinis aurantiacus]